MTRDHAILIDPTALQLPAPTDWQAFERIVRRLFGRAMNDPNMLRVGREGQDQGGVDVIGRRLNGHRGYVGIQCKLKDEMALDRRLGRATFEAEVRAALAVRPPLAEFILATTAADDVALQQQARELTVGLEAEGRDVSIHVYGWNRLRELIGEHEDILRDYIGFGQGIAEEIAAGQEAIIRRLDALVAPVPPPLPAEGEDTPLSRLVRRARDRVDAGELRRAIAELDELREHEWQSASPKDRFGILTGLAAAWWRLGDEAKAADLVEQASEQLPGEESTLANLATAHLFKGRFEEARATVLRLLALKPDSENGLAVLVQAQELISPLLDPMAIVPPDRRGTEEAMTGLMQVLRTRDDPEWRRVAFEGATLYPDSELLRRGRAEAVLDRMASRDANVAGPPAEGAERAEIDTALDTLRELWTAQIALDPERIDGSFAHNLAQLLRFVNEIDEAIEVIEQAEALGASSPELGRLHAVLLASSDRTEQARAILAALPPDPASSILLMHLLHGDAPDRVREIAAAVDWSDADDDTLLMRDMRDALARAALEPGWDPDPELARMSDHHPGRLAALIEIARRKPREEWPSAAIDLFTKVTAATPVRDVMIAAEWMRHTRQWRPLLDLLRDRVLLDRDGFGLRWMIEAMAELNDREGLVAVFDVLPQSVSSADPLLEAKQGAFFNAGDLPTARAAADELVARRPDNVRQRLAWATILHRQGDRHEVEAWLDGPVETLDGDPQAMSELAFMMNGYGRTERARALAYQLARLHPGIAQIQTRFIGIMLGAKSDGDQGGVEVPVGVDSVFTVIDDKGGTRTYRIEGESGLPREPIDIDMDAPVAKAACGLTEGDQFAMDTGHLVPASLKVASSLHKHVYLLRELLETLDQRFPGHGMFTKVVFDPSTGTGMEEMTARLRQDREIAEGVLETYRENATPIRLLAPAIAQDVVEVYDRLVASGMVVHAASGGQRDQQAEEQAIVRNRRRGCLVDCITLELIRRMDLEDLAETILGPLHITQSTVDILASAVDRMRAGLGRTLGTMSESGGRPVAFVVHPITLDAGLEERRRSLDWACSVATVVTANGPRDLAASIHAQWPARIADAIADDMLAAAEHGLILLSEDLGYRRLSAMTAQVPNAGLQSLIAVARGAKAGDEDLTVRALARLAGSGHRVIRIGARDLLLALRIDGGVPGDTLDAMSRALGGDHADPASHFGVASEFLEAVWPLPQMIAHRATLAFRLARQLLAGSDEARMRLVERIVSDPDRAPEAFRNAAAEALARAASA